MNLGQFLRGFDIVMDSEPLQKNPFQPSDGPKLYHHKCTFKFVNPREYGETSAPRTRVLWGREITIPGVPHLEREGRSQILKGPERRILTVPYSTPDPNTIRAGKDQHGKLIYVSHLHAKDVLLAIAIEAALYEIAKGDKEVWAGIYALDTEQYSDADVDRLYQNVSRQAWELRVFLEGREAAEMHSPSTYYGLLFAVDEVASAIYRILYEKD